MTREDLEARVNAGKGMVQKWEAEPGVGDSRNVKDGTLLNIAMATGVRFDWLREGEEPMWDAPNRKIGHRLAAILKEGGWPEAISKHDQAFLTKVSERGTRNLDEMVNVERILIQMGQTNEAIEHVLIGPETHEDTPKTQAMRRGLIEWATSQGLDLAKIPEHEALDMMAKSKQPKQPQGVAEKHQGYSSIPIFNVLAAAGAPYTNGEESIEDEILFSTGFLRHGLRVHPQNAAIVHINGDSMSRDLNPGDLVLVDLNPNARAGDGIFLLRHGDGNLIKSLQRLPGGAFRVISTNETYPPYTISPEEAEATGFEVLGRVVCALKRM